MKHASKIAILFLFLLLLLFAFVNRGRADKKIKEPTPLPTIQVHCDLCCCPMESVSACVSSCAKIRAYKKKKEFTLVSDMCLDLCMLKAFGCEAEHTHTKEAK